MARWSILRVHSCFFVTNNFSVAQVNNPHFADYIKQRHRHQKRHRQRVSFRRCSLHSSKEAKHSSTSLCRLWSVSASTSTRISKKNNPTKVLLQTRKKIFNKYEAWRSDCESLHIFCPVVDFVCDLEINSQHTLSWHPYDPCSRSDRELLHTQFQSNFVSAECFRLWPDWEHHSPRCDRNRLPWPGALENWMEDQNHTIKMWNRNWACIATMTTWTHSN